MSASVQDVTDCSFRLDRIGYLNKSWACTRFETFMAVNVPYFRRLCQRFSYLNSRLITEFRQVHFWVAASVPFTWCPKSYGFPPSMLYILEPSQFTTENMDAIHLAANGRSITAETLPHSRPWRVQRSDWRHHASAASDTDPAMCHMQTDASAFVHVPTLTGTWDTCDKENTNRR